jgi:hypothetical protein
LPIKEVTIKNTETGDLITVEVCVCKYCNKDFQKYDCDVFREMNIIRTEHINICKDCHKRLVPEISGIKSTADFYDPTTRQLKPEYQPDPVKLEEIRLRIKTGKMI